MRIRLRTINPMIERRLGEAEGEHAPRNGRTDPQSGSAVSHTESDAQEVFGR